MLCPSPYSHGLSMVYQMLRDLVLVPFSHFPIAFCFLIMPLLMCIPFLEDHIYFHFLLSIVFEITYLNVFLRYWRTEEMKVYQSKSAVFYQDWSVPEVDCDKLKIRTTAPRAKPLRKQLKIA